jgi:muramoyltetrapeptide carboxypeptidase
MAKLLKPLALRPGDGIRVLSLASPAHAEHLRKGCEELKLLGYTPLLDRESALAREGFFAGSAASRIRAFEQAKNERAARAIFCSRGGYGSSYLIEELANGLSSSPKIFLGASDITSLQLFLWTRFRWITFYGPMVASNFDRGSGAPHGYDSASLLNALTETRQGWRIHLEGTALVEGSSVGVLLGGCLTLVEASLGTPWEIDTKGAILVLEDRGMKPYQVDRSLMHLKYAGKFRAVAGLVLGDFPECDPLAENESVEDVARRILTPLGVPVVWGAPIGHTSRAMLTLPLGVQAELTATGDITLRILEPACS